ncbi:hypothetical protein [Kordiimonas sp.]|uniref:hypothetical protein n=1 Tax=Kordiimonas sp. TaxID=1970157 RepID=UPI003A95AA21
MTKPRPTRRTFMGTMFACVAAPSLPKIAVPEMRFHSVSIGGEVSEIFYNGFDDDRCWEIVPAYDADGAIRQMRATIRKVIAGSSREWPTENEWEIETHASVAESEVIESAKEWDVSFDDAAARLMNWQCECDISCEHCGMYSMDQRVPTCGECYRCKFCVDAGDTYWDGGDRTGKCEGCCW